MGVDCAAVDLGGRIAVLSTDPITAADKNIGSLTVHVSCNDAAAAGAEPIGLLVTLLIPPHGTEEEVEHIAQELAEAAKQPFYEGLARLAKASLEGIQSERALDVAYPRFYR